MLLALIELVGRLYPVVCEPGKTRVSTQLYESGSSATAAVDTRACSLSCATQPGKSGIPRVADSGRAPFCRTTAKNAQNATARADSGDRGRSVRA